MLNRNALANAAAVTVLIAYVAFYIIFLILPATFHFLLDAQLFGAEVSSLLVALTFGKFVGLLITNAILAWIFGYLFAALYNRFLKQK